MEANPYAPPKAEILNAPTDAERIRQEHIKTESTIKTTGAMYYLVGFLVSLSGLSAAAGPAPLETRIGFLVVLAVGALMISMGYGLRKLRRWTRIPTILFSIVGLLLFPLGTLINGLILANIVSRKATTVLSPAYQEIIAATPHVRQKSSKAAMAVLIILLGVLTWVIYLAWNSSVN